MNFFVGLRQQQIYPKALFVLIFILIPLCACGKRIPHYAMSKPTELIEYFGEMLLLTENKLQNPDYFILHDTDILIPLAQCTCEYKSDDIQIYSKDVSDFYIGILPPDRYTVFYISTSADFRQILTSSNHWIDSENGAVYVMQVNVDGLFESIYKYGAESAQSGKTVISEDEVLSVSTIEGWIADAYHLLPENHTESIFSNLKLRVTALEHEQEDVLIKGEASGVYGGFEKTYYIDWELDETSSKEKITPYILKIYDTEKDKEVFDDCEKAYDLVEQWDWSLVIPFEGLENCIKAKKDFNSHYPEREQWRRADVNGDGLPELVSLYNYSYGGDAEKIIPINYIFTYKNGQLEQVFTDYNDMTEFLFLGENGNLIYHYDEFGQMDYGSYTRYQFDEKWNRRKLEKLEVYYFYDEKTYEEEIAYYKERYPDTYGTYGCGFYYFYSYFDEAQETDAGEIHDTNWKREAITEKEFVDAYRKMTGLEFFTEETDFAVHK